MAWMPQRISATIAYLRQKQFVHGKVQNTVPSRQRIRRKKTLQVRRFVSAEFWKAEGAFAQAARTRFFDHDGVATTNRIRRVVGHRTRLEHEDIAFHQRQIEM